MKRRDILKKLKKAAKDRGVDYTETEGANHTKVEFGDGSRTVVARHNEISEGIAREIFKQMGMEK